MNAEETARLNVVDVEATCWDGAPPQDQVNEIIEIGLTVVDLVTRARLTRHRILVRPQQSTVSPFCTELTGLSQAEVDNGISFADACAMLTAEHQAGVLAWASWGEYDRKQFQRQCQTTGTPYPFGDRHLNAKTLFAAEHGLRRPVGMDQALTIASLPLEGRHHRGDDDAWNIAALVLHLAERGAWPMEHAA